MRSLRGRLTLGITLVLAVVLAGAGVVVSRYVERSEREALDDRLKRTVEFSRETALSAVERELPSADQRLDNVLSASGTSLRLLLDGRELPAFGRPPPPGRPPPRDGFQTFEAGGERYRSYTIRLEALGGLARLEVTTRLAPLERKLSALNRRLLGFGAAALLVAALGAWFAADVMLRPLRRLRRATAGDRRHRGPRPPRAGRRRAGRAALAGGELQRDARAARALGGRPRARAGGDAALHRRRRARAAHAADERAGQPVGAEPPPRHAGRAARGDGRGRAGGEPPARRAARRAAGARARRRDAARARRRRPRRSRRRRAGGGAGALSGREWSCELPDEPVVVRGLGAGAADPRRQPARQRGAPRRRDGGGDAVAAARRAGRSCASTTTAPASRSRTASGSSSRSCAPTGSRRRGRGSGWRSSASRCARTARRSRWSDSPLGGARFSVRFAGG